MQRVRGTLDFVVGFKAPRTSCYLFIYFREIIERVRLFCYECMIELEIDPSRWSFRFCMMFAFKRNTTCQMQKEKDEADDKMKTYTKTESIDAN